MNDSIEPESYSKIKLPNFTATGHLHPALPEQPERQASQDDPLLVVEPIDAIKENINDCTVNNPAQIIPPSPSSSSVSSSSSPSPFIDNVINNDPVATNDSSQSLQNSIEIASNTLTGAPTQVTAISSSLGRTPTAKSRLQLLTAPTTSSSQHTDAVKLAASIPKKYRQPAGLTATKSKPAMPVISGSAAEVASLSSSMRGINESMLRTPRLVQPTYKHSSLQFCQQQEQHQESQTLLFRQLLLQQQQQTHPQLKEEEFAEVLIENQRGWFLFGFPFFSANTLFPLDPSPWTCGPAGATTAPGDISSFPLPAPGWEWAWSRWYIDMGYDVDDQGWSYSFNFGSNSRWHGSHVWFHSFVRRRRWIRLRRRQLPVATDGDGTPISLPSGGAPSAAPKYYMSPMRYFPVPRAQLRREEEAANEARSMVLDFSGDGGCSSDMAIEQLLCRLRGARLDRERTAIVMRFFGLSSSAACSHAAIKAIPPISTVDAEVLVEDAEFVRQLIDTFTYLDSKNQLVSLLSAEALRLTSQPPALDSRDTNNDDDDYDDDGKSFADLQTNISEAELMEPPSNATTVPAPQTPTVDSRRALVLEKLAKTCANLVKQEQYYNED